jgi:AraC-like DNA-binding protein
MQVIKIQDHQPTINHLHDFGELVIITSGRAIHCVEDQKYRIEAGDVFVILGSTQHGYEDTQSLGLINVLLDWDRIPLPMIDIGTLPGYQALFQVEPHLRGCTHFKNHLRLNEVQLDELLVMVSSLERELKSKSAGYKFASISWLSAIILYLSRTYGSEGKHAGSVSGLSRVLSYLEENLDSSHQIRDLADLAGMSEATLFREFVKVVGRSPIEHLLHLRIERAKRLLKSSKRRIGDVASQVGFEDSNYFSRQFRAIVGISPREWQKASIFPVGGKPD